jgi:DNA-binding NarL/FixJ family response regulator
MSDSISILLVDDHAMVRDTLGRRLAEEPDMTVLGTAETADEAVEQVLRTRPRVVVMDIDMPGLISFEAARTIGERCSDTAIVFLSAFTHDRYIEQALSVGAAGYVAKSEPAESVVTAIRAAASGSAYYSPEVQARIVVDTAGPQLACPAQSRGATLSDREVQVLSYVARGMSHKEIARTMHLSVNTVHRHTSRLMEKLDIHDRVELARFAIREGLAEA